MAKKISSGKKLLLALPIVAAGLIAAYISFWHGVSTLEWSRETPESWEKFSVGKISFYHPPELQVSYQNLEPSDDRFVFRDQHGKEVFTLTDWFNQSASSDLNNFAIGEYRYSLQVLPDIDHIEVQKASTAEGVPGLYVRDNDDDPLEQSTRVRLYFENVVYGFHGPLDGYADGEHEGLYSVEDIALTSTFTSANDINSRTDKDYYDLKAFDGKTGAFQAEGYLYTKTVPEAWCEQDCRTFERSFFRVEETPNDQVLEYIYDRQGNAYFDENAISFGCIEDGVLRSDSAPAGTNIQLSEQDTARLTTATAENPVVVQIEIEQEPEGRGGFTCSTLVDSVQVL